MLWEGRSLRDIREADIRTLLDSGLEEHEQLEYKSALYEDNDRGRKEFLLDIGMFANTSGGVLLIGIPEQRDGDGQPMGVPDPRGIIGLELPNPEAQLGSYDARVMESIEERLPLESASIDLLDGRRVLVIRVSNSTRKPHSVRHQGHTYFPARRERQRYHLTVREIKELVMRTASRLQQAEDLLEKAFLAVPLDLGVPYLLTGMIPVFSEDFLVEVRNENVRTAITRFTRAGGNEYVNPEYSFAGIERRGEGRFNHNVTFGRNGLLIASQKLPLVPRDGEHQVGPVGIDRLLRQFVLQARAVYNAAAVSPPYVLGMMLRIRQPLIGVYATLGGYGEDHSQPVGPGDYRFPFMQVEDLVDIDRIIRPLCDQTHQMFGREGSPSFNAEGMWIER